MKRIVRITIFGTIVSLVVAVPNGRAEEEGRHNPIIAAVEESVRAPRGRHLGTLAELMEKYSVPAISIAVWDDYAIIWSKAYGVMNTDNGESATTDTLFQAASISKPVTCVAALDMVEDGIWSLDEPFEKYLVSWRIPAYEWEDTAPVTLRHILSHRAGFSVSRFPGYRDTARIPTVIDILDGVAPANTDPVIVEYEPGTKWQYSGGGYTVVQLAMTDLMDKPFAEIVTRRVLEPAGMTDSAFDQPPTESRAGRCAAGHDSSGRTLRGLWRTHPELAAAGLWSTPADIAKFAINVQESLRSNTDMVLEPETARDAISEIDASGFGLGFQVTDDSFSHAGTNRGFRCHFRASKHGGWGVAIMTNGDSGERIYRSLQDTIINEYGWTEDE